LKDRRNMWFSFNAEYQTKRCGKLLLRKIKPPRSCDGINCSTYQIRWMRLLYSSHNIMCLTWHTWAYFLYYIFQQ